MDANKTHRQKSKQVLHKNATNYFEQTLGATPNKTTVRPLTSYLKKHLDEQDKRQTAGEAITNS